MKANAAISETYGLDDVLLLPNETGVKPSAASTKTRLTKTIELNIPIISAGRDNVTESPMAIAMAHLGGLGVIHHNMPAGKQVEEVRRVKRAEGNMVLNPITISPEASVAEAVDLMTNYRVSGLPVAEAGTQKVVGIITGRDIRFFEDYAKPVSELMSKEVVTAQAGVQMDAAKKLMHAHRIEKIVVVDAQGRCAGLVTVKDIDKLARFPQATRDRHGRLRVGACVRTGKDAIDRAAAMADAGLDVLFIDVAHAHSREVLGTVSHIRQQRSSEVQIVAGNVVTPEAARSLIDSGADAVMVGIGGHDRSASRRLAGVGVPQLSAVVRVAEQCAMMGVPVIVNGGVCSPSAFAKAIAAGAEAVIFGGLFAGTDEAPGEIVCHEGGVYKVVNPAAKAQHRPPASATAAALDPLALDEDAPDTSVPYRGPVAHTVQHLVAGLKAAMAYTGSADIPAMIENAEFVRKPS
ncbi:MAG: IMP dehydrogenase [Alphaproteobacteria bacterium]|nr:IMP dehydrogenase [Alphaproteobacteria bacterium]MDE2337224.1 IMP dehydrogenase [Alphaproteobacteria bacterium]